MTEKTCIILLAMPIFLIIHLRYIFYKTKLITVSICHLHKNYYNYGTLAPNKVIHDFTYI